MTAEKPAYEPSPGDRLHVWPGARLPGIEPRRALALTGPVPFGGTTCVRVEYLSGRRIGGTDYIALTHADPDGSAGGDAQPAAYPPWPKELGERPAWLDHLSDEALRRQWEAIKDQRRKLQAALRDLDEQEEPLVAEHMSRRGMWRPRPAGNPDSAAGKSTSSDVASGRPE